MRPDKFKLANEWIYGEATPMEEAKATWEAMDAEFNENRKIMLAESNPYKDNFNTPDLEQSEFLEPKRIDIFGNVIPAETLEDWDVTFRRPNAEGGRIPFNKGKEVRISKNQYGEFETTYKKPTTLLDKYQNMLDDYAELVKDSLRLNDGTNLPKNFKEYVNNYSFADGTKAKYATYANLVARRSDTKYTKSLKPPVDVVNVKLKIMDNLITESNAGNKATNLTTLAKKVNWTDKDISNYKRQGKIKKLDSPADKVDKVYKNFFNNLDAPLEDFFNPIYKMSEETGLNRGTVSTLLNKNPNYTDEGKKLFKALGTFSLKGKYAQEGFTIGQFLDDFENRLFVGENGLLSMRNYNKPTSAIVLDAYRHWDQGGKQIEWINPPKMDKKGNLISLADAQFKYKGPNSSNTIWSASGNTVNGVKSKSIAIFGKDAPEFQKVFQDYEDIFRLENEIKPHPVTGKPTKMIDISKEAYNIGKGSSFGTSNLARDHVNIIKDVFGNDPKYGTRILPRRVNEYAGALKAIEQATKKGISKNYTQNKIDKIYEKMGYNFTKNYDQILNDEYNLAKKVFNKFQAAGWGFDQNTNRWVIKEGFDVETAKNVDARGNPKNPNKILQSPFKMVEEKEKILDFSKTTSINKKINQKDLSKALQNFEKYGCNLAAGGRILFATGSPFGKVTKCADKGIARFLNDIKSGNYTETTKRLFRSGGNLLKGILNPMELLKLRNYFGPAALGFMAAFEAGVITDDVFRMGQPLNESLASNWLTKSFTPYSLKHAEISNLIKNNKLPSNMLQYAKDAVKFEEAKKEMQRIESLQGTRVIDGSGYGLIDGTSVYPQEQEAKDVKGVEDMFKNIKDLSVIMPGSAKEMELQKLLTEKSATEMAKKGFSPIFGFGNLKDRNQTVAFDDYMSPVETPKDLRPVTYLDAVDYKDQALPSSVRQSYENFFSSPEGGNYLKPRQSLSELKYKDTNILDELTKDYNNARRIKLASELPGFYGTQDDREFMEGGIASLNVKKK